MFPRFYIMKQLLFIITACFFANATFAAKVDTMNVYSVAMKKDIPCLFITPDPRPAPAGRPIATKLPSAANSKKHYPTVYVLHGYTGNALRTLKLDLPDLKNQADAYQMIFVLADGGYDSWYFDSPKTDALRYESFLSKDLVQFTDQHYPTLPVRDKRAIYGWSRGGHGALFIAIRDKELFGAAGSICGAVDFRPLTKDYGIEKSN